LYRKKWLDDKKIQNIPEVVSQELDAVAVAYASAPLFVEYIGRIQGMQLQVDARYRAKLFLEGPSDQKIGRELSRSCAQTIDPWQEHQMLEISVEAVQKEMDTGTKTYASAPLFVE
jgi:hypothetical protein